MAAVVTVSVSGCSFHGVQGIYGQDAGANYKLGRILSELRQIEADLRARP